MRIPFVVTVHDVRRQKRILNSHWEDGQLEKVYRSALTLLVHSEGQKRELIQFAGVNPQTIRIVPHGPYCYSRIGPPVDIRRELGIDPSANTGLFFGGIRDEKGLDRLITAVAGLAEAHLIVAGTSPSGKHKPVAHYRRLAQSLGAEHRVHFMESFIPDKCVPDLFAAADWCGLPYDSEFTSQSGVLSTAAFFKKPLLVGPAPTLLETVRKYEIGVAVEDHSVNALRNAIEALRKEAGRRTFCFGKYNIECAWARNAEITCDAYRSLVQC